MKNFLIILAFYSGLTFNSLSCKNKQSTGIDVKQTPLTDTTIKKQKVSENHFETLRRMALNVTPDVLKITMPKEETKVFGIVMDWDIGEGIVTTTSFETGDASMYMSSGTMILGGIGREKVAIAAKSFVNKAQEFQHLAIKADSTPLPDKDCVKFYLLTNKGTFSFQEKIARFEDNSSYWLPLFLEGNRLITEIRKVEQTSGK